MLFKQHRIKSLLSNLTVIPDYEWPSDTDRFLLSVIQDEGVDYQSRLSAVELAGNLSVVNPDLVEEFRKIAENKTEEFELRISAISAMAPIFEEVIKPSYLETVSAIDAEEDIITIDSLTDAVKAVKEIYFNIKEEEEIRRQALKTAVRVFDDWQIEAVRKAYAEDNVEWKSTAVFCMRYLEGFNKEILESIRSQNSEIKLNAIEAAAKHELVDAWGEVEKVIKYERANIDLLCAAIYAAPVLNPSGYRDVLVNLPEDGEVSEAVTMVMG